MNGAEPKTGSFLPFALPDITDAEIAAVSDTLRSGWITTGPRAKELEQRFATSKSTTGTCS